MLWAPRNKKHSSSEPWLPRTAPRKSKARSLPPAPEDPRSGSGDVLAPAEPCAPRAAQPSESPRSRSSVLRQRYLFYPARSPRLTRLPTTRGGSARPLLLGLGGSTSRAGVELRGAPPRAAPRPAPPRPVPPTQTQLGQRRLTAQPREAPSWGSVSTNYLEPQHPVLDSPKTESCCSL